MNVLTSKANLIVIAHHNNCMINPEKDSNGILGPHTPLILRLIVISSGN